MTLDGFIEDSKDPQMNWVTDIFSEEMGDEVKKLQTRFDTLILGKTTYDILASYWPTASPQKDDPVIINQMNDANKIVFSKTVTMGAWKHSKFLGDINAEEIKKIKLQPGKDMTIMGSASIVKAFAALDLIDEYHLMIHPVIVGSGKKIFDTEHRKNLELVNAKTLDNRVVLLWYKPINKS